MNDQDEFAGMGGSYVLENGVRRLVQRSNTEVPAAEETPAQAPEQTPETPAD